MKILKGNYGECWFIDNMDKDYGLPSLADKSWDLCLTDPPYGISFKANRNNTTNYDDSELLMSWFEPMQQIAESILFFGGYRNIGYLLSNYDVELGVWHHPTKQGTSVNAKKNPIEPFFTHNVKLSTSLIRLVATERPMGFYNGKDLFKTIHPSPKDKVIIDWILKDLLPQSVIDPFLGSGTTAQVCETLGIPWLGYEIMEEYSVDIEKRIQKGIVEHSRYKPQKKTKITTLGI